MSILLHTFLSAQQPVGRQITEDDGLPDNEIYFLKQDRKGIIWISTNSGLCRYNGQGFRYYASPLLKSKATGCICEDSYGRIWANNFAGQLFYVQDDSLVVFNLPDNIRISSVAPFAIGPHNELVVTTEQNRTAVFKPMHSFSRQAPLYQTDTVLQYPGINPFYDSDGKLWFSASLLPAGNKAVVATYTNGSLGLTLNKAEAKNAIRYVTQLNGNMYYFLRDENKLYKVEGNEAYPDQQVPVPGFINVAPLKNGKVAFSTNDGLYICARQPSGNFTIEQKLIGGQTISAFCEDKLGNLWIGTLSEGIWFYPAQGLRQLTNPVNAPLFSTISTVSEGPAGTLLLGYFNGELGSMKAGVYKKLVVPNPYSTKIQSLFYSPEMQMLNWSSDKVYLSAFAGNEKQMKSGNGLVYSAKDMVFIPKWKAALIASPADIQLMSLDDVPVNQRIPPGWLNGNEIQAEKKSDTSKAEVRISLVLSKERGRAVYFDEATNTCWGADKNGITLHRENSKSNIRWKNESIYATSFCSYEGNVYAGTFSQGLIVIRNEKAFLQYTINDGLASNTIYKIIAGKNHLWILTDKGIQYFDPSTGGFYLIDKTLGLPGFKINGAALVKDNLYVSTPGGLLYIPDTIRLSRDTGLRVYLRNVYCNRQTADTLRHRFGVNENSFSFSVETPAYNNRALLRYKYRLKGVDNDFLVVPISTDFFEYKSLQSGNYTFEIYLTGTDEKPLSAPVTYTFSISPPYYRTTWFRIVVAGFIVLLIGLLFRQRLRKVQQREQEKLKLARLESDLNRSQLAGIKAQMNPHFMFNALNSIQEFILLNDKKSANMYMGKFADLMRMTLDMSNSQDVLLEDEIKMLQLYLELEALRFEDAFHWTVNAAADVEPEYIRIPAMLIQPHIENAVKHGLLHRTGIKEIAVHFYLKSPTLLCCTITDNGIGRKRSGEINAQRLKKHTSFATGAMQKRIELLNVQLKAPISMQYEDLTDASGNGTGTRVEICIPL
ncbi:MAG: histidine kinase [Bacteroidetes bacterium]|nr:histidine kinase [Bacteroidota bacterium]